MFALREVILTNFRSFRGNHTFEFPTDPGLYCVTGENRDNPRLGREGIGKSSLLEAVFWCFYGRTTRSLKGGDVVSWGAKGCSVSVTVLINNRTVTVERTQNPNSLILNGKPVEQDAVNKELRLKPEAFCYAVMLPQFGESFFDLKPSEKLTLFSDIMELDFWLEKSKDADLAAKQLTELKVVKERALARCQGQLESAKADVKTINIQMVSFDQNKGNDVKELKVKLAKAKTLLETEEKQLKVAKASLAGAEARLEKLAVPNMTAGHAVTALRGTLAKMKGLGAQCPTCFQTVPESHLKAEAARLKKELAEAEAEEKKANQLIQDRRTITQNRDDFAREQRTIENRKNSLGRDVAELTVKLKSSEKAANPYAEMLTAKQQQISGLNSELGKIQAEIDNLSQELAVANFWISGFKRVRLSLVEETLSQLEIEVNNNLANLGLTDWRIEFDIERENKSGGVTKGFVVLVYAPRHKSPVKYESWCGGETQRLRLAGDLGLANLIMERAGLDNKFESFDEPSQHMGSEGLTDLAEALADRAESAGKVIMLVDHHVIDFGGFSGKIEIIKDSNGSHFREKSPRRRAGAKSRED